ncbi:MAG: UDP-glucose 4-epimerase GalE [Clostridia bacterium]|nr:UDP-glucose 4-epimerase GalE [Clostridia bacterium]
MKILVTGGLGFIGSHTVVELINAGYDVVIVDNLNNSQENVLERLEKITNKKIKLYKDDVTDRDSLRKIFSENNTDNDDADKIGAVIHFAGYKAVGESVKEPLKYYENNLFSAITLLEVMKEFGVKKFLFSSSATVYGETGTVVYSEDMGRGKTTNPYGTTKAMVEEILEDLYKSDNSWDITILRYFNPVGAHESGLIGEAPNGIPNNLMPYVMKVASGDLEMLSIFGNDYPTKDGTGVRDFIHVVDLAKGHVKALQNAPRGLSVYNLGAGRGVSVLELVNTFEKVNNIKVPYRIAERRAGDLAEYYADSSKAYMELGWKTEKTVEDICRDSWRFQKNSKNFN